MIDGGHNEECSRALSSVLKSEYSDKEILDLLIKKNAKFEYYDIADIPKIAAKYLNDNKVIGLFHGRMEFGPRALGHRSIIANATDDKMQKRVNMKRLYYKEEKKRRMDAD